MPDPVKLLGAMVISAAISASMLLLVVRLAGRSRPLVAAAGAPCGALIGVIVASLFVGVTFHIPPREDLDRMLLVLFPVAALVEMVAAFRKQLAIPLRILLAVLVAPILLQGSVYLTDLSGPGSREWTAGQTFLHLGGLAGLLFIVGEGTRQLTQRSAGRAVPLALAGVIFGAGVTVMLSGYASGGQLGFPISATLIGIVVASCLWAGRLDIAPLSSFGVTALFSLLMIGHYFGELDLLNALILGVSPLCGWLIEFPGFRRVPVPARGVSRLIVTAVPVVIVLLLAQHQFTVASKGPASSEAEASGGLSDYISYGK